MDIVTHVERLPAPGETVRGSDIQLFPGGKGANQACAAARAGGAVTMLGSAGQDAFGEMLLASLAQMGVATARVRRSATATGCALISVLPSGENSIVISAGANAEVSESMLLANQDLFKSGSTLLAQLEIGMDAVEAAFRLAHAAGATTILDPAPVAALSTELLRRTSFLTPNQTEAAALLRQPSLAIADETAAAKAAEELLRTGVNGVILKLGSLGCYVAHEGTRAFVPAFPMRVIDTTAAGDVFNGFFAVYLAEGKSVIESARFANAAAALSVTRAGAQASIPAREEAEALM